MRVLIVRLGAFGDIIHTLPLMADLCAAGMRVDWVLEDRWAPILRGSAALGTIHEVPRKSLRGKGSGFCTRWLAWRRLTRQLRACDYQVVIDAQGLAKSALVAAGAGARLRVGHGRAAAREFSWLVSDRRSPTCVEHVIDRQRALALPLLGARHPRGPWRFPLPAWPAERAWALSWIGRHDLPTSGPGRAWMLNVGAGWPTKVWPLRRQIEFARLLSRRRQPLVLLWGSHAEHDLAEEIISEAGYGLLAPPTTIPQLAGLIAAAQLVVSGDTGPLHLSLALGTPAVGLFGPVPAARNGPRGSGYRTLQAPGALWERRDVSLVDMAAIAAEQVVSAALQALADRQPRAMG
jgi:lipopolysaccharide heptosyltransferase I